jgi:hypothetical protein
MRSASAGGGSLAAGLISSGAPGTQGSGCASCVRACRGAVGPCHRSVLSRWSNACPALVCPDAYPASASRVYSHGDLVMIQKGHFFFPMSFGDFYYYIYEKLFESGLLSS